jgi:hypothetical protein
MNRCRTNDISRRTFLTQVTLAGAATVAAPTILTARKTDTPLIVGSGEYRYEVIHNWPQLPDKFTWQTTHNVAIDRQGFVYVIHEGRENLPDHPSIFVFDPDGRFVRSFGQQYQGGGHGLEVREEDGQEFLYVCAYQQVKAFSKLDLKGEVVWHRHAPMEAEIYAAGEATNPRKQWGRDRFMPTNFAFLPNGEFLLSDGYGSYYIHHYDKDGNWQRMYGGPGDGQGRFDTPHGIGFDNRPGREPTVVVCDRAHHTLQLLALDGTYQETLSGFGLPANIDTWRDLMLVPELHARVTILDGKNQPVVRLGGDVDRVTSQQGIRSNPQDWIPGKFVHPHDACFDSDGNIFVAEWVATGRVSKLRRLDA